MTEQDWNMLRGIVEADETYVGGEGRNGQSSKRNDAVDQPER